MKVFGSFFLVPVQCKQWWVQIYTHKINLDTYLWRDLMEGIDRLPFFLGWPCVFFYRHFVTFSVAWILPWLLLSAVMMLLMTICFFGQIPSLYISLSLNLTHTNTQLLNFNLMINESVSSFYQCNPGQVLWHHQHLRRGAAWCYDRRFWNRHLQRVSMHVSYEKTKNNS